MKRVHTAAALRRHGGRLRLLVALAMAFGLLAAGLAQTGAQTASRGTLHFWAVTGSVDDVRMYERIAADFERREHIHVEITPLAWGNFETKYFAAMAAGMPPDAGGTNLGGPFNYGSVGGLVDLRKLQAETGEPLESLYPEKMLGMFKVGKQLFAVPATGRTSSPSSGSACRKPGPT